MHALKWLFLGTLMVGTPTLTSTTYARDHDEEVVKLSDVPQAARDALVREAKGATIVKVEKEKKKNGRVLYEAVVKQGDEMTGIVVEANGTLVGKHSEKEERE